jgi:transposase InsO family protein
MATRLTKAALEQAIATRQPAPGLVHHSDRGLQYASNESIGCCGTSRTTGLGLARITMNSSLLASLGTATRYVPHASRTRHTSAFRTYRFISLPSLREK